MIFITVFFNQIYQASNKGLIALLNFHTPGPLFSSLGLLKFNEIKL